jgi:hypothetical protein
MLLEWLALIVFVVVCPPLGVPILIYVVFIHIACACEYLHKRYTTLHNQRGKNQ